MSEDNGNFNYRGPGATLRAPKYDKLKEPMPCREELLARNSFGGPDNNPYLKVKKP